MQHLLQHIKSFHSLSEAAQADLQEGFEEVVLSKGAHLIAEGQRCHHLYFVEKGALRGYYNLDGKEITHWFAFEADFVTSFHSFITGAPAVENIQLMEGSILWSLSKERLTALLNKHHEIERLLRIAYEGYYIRLEERFVNAQFKTATERYVELLQQRSYLIERVPLGYIASFLGISSETLSRIRSRL